MARRQDLDKPFLDIEGGTESFSIPLRKWRELLFIGAIVREGECYVRNPSRPLPSFRIPDLFPKEARFRVNEDEKRVFIQRIE
jgi:hypothetical protein